MKAFAAHPSFRARRSGSALLIILGCVALLTILVTAFLLSARTEFTTSNFYAKGVSTKLLSENVINLVTAQLREGARSTDVNTSAPVAWASQPGMIRTYDNSGNPYKYFKLYSWDNMVGTGQFIDDAAAEEPPTTWSAQPNIYTDLNEPVNGTYPILDPAAEDVVEGFSINTASVPGVSTSSPLPMPVKWLYVLKDGSVSVGVPKGSGTAVTITNASTTNPVIGRVAFWADDETSKVNINTASEGIFWDQPYGNNTNEMGIHNSAPPPFGFAGTLPSAAEYARVPGHPGTTSLSAVFGFGTNPILPDTNFVTSDPNALTWPLTPDTYTANFAPYYSLTPRYQAGATMGGSQSAPETFTLPGYRLYDSVDELAFDPSRQVITGAANPALYLAGTGADPSGRVALTLLTPKVIQQRSFFLTAHSRAPEETLFGTPRISLWPLQEANQTPSPRTAKDNLLAFCSTINGQPYYFQRAGFYQYQDATGDPVTNSPQTVPSAISATEDFPGAPTSTPKTGVARNENLYAYLQALTGGTVGGLNNIPGFGGNFYAKYPGAADSTGILVSDRDEILTEMFDLIRSGVNTYNTSPNILPHYTYTPFKANMAENPYNGPPDPGETVPINIPSLHTHGLGRSYHFGEVSLVFMAKDIDLNDGQHSNAVVESAGTLDSTTNPTANPHWSPTSPLFPPGAYSPPTPRRMSIGPNLPWANEEDYPPSGHRVFLYYDQTTKTYGTYYMANAPTDPPFTAARPFVYTVPPNTNTPLDITSQNAAIPVPIFCYWDSAVVPPSTPQYRSYFLAPPQDSTNNGKLFVCPSPGVVLPQKYATLLAPTAPLTPLPSTAVTIADPQTTAVQAFVLLQPHTVVTGTPAVEPNIRVRVSGLDGLSVQLPGVSQQSLKFPSGPNAFVCYNSATTQSGTIDSLGGLLAPFGSNAWQLPADTWLSGTTFKTANTVNVNAYYNDGTNPSNFNYPLISVPVSPSSPAYPSLYGGEDASGINQQNGAGSTTPALPVNPPAPVQIHNFFPGSETDTTNTMTINGALLTVDVFDGTSDLTQPTTQPFETFYVKIPPMALPIPTVEMANQEGEACGGGGYNPNSATNNISGPRIPGYLYNTNPSPLYTSGFNLPPNMVLNSTPSAQASYGTPLPIFGTYYISGYPGMLYNNAPFGGSPPYQAQPGMFQPLNYYWQLPWDVRSLAQRLSWAWSQNYTSLRSFVQSDRIICRGDIVRSFVPNPTPGTINGDVRLLVANPIRNAPTGTAPNLTSDDYVPLGSARAGGYSSFPVLGPYTSKFIHQLHTLTAQYGNRNPLNLFQTSFQILTDGPQSYPGNTNPTDGPLGYIGQQAGGIGETEGQLIPNEESAYQSAPNVTPELQGAFMDSASQIPGDWTLGMGPTPDGAFLQKPDEGYQVLGTGSNGRSYYTTDIGDADLTQINISYSPNREVPSPIIFGGLPSRAMQGIPWCTLLFCPNPAANDNDSTNIDQIHPGFGTPGAPSPGATNDPAYFSPPYTLPPDHLFLDLFWMPVVEPYAISEPFSTAGKVNMNYAIVPFGYINRSTALHAVMKSTQLLAVPTKYNNENFIQPTATTPPDYENFQGGYPSFKSIAFWYEDDTWNGGSPYDYACRYGINLTATIDAASSAFQQRFGVHDIFRSATEICNVFLVPQTINGLNYSPAATAQPLPADASYNSMQTWWSNFQLTGDNGREDPYTQIYPRLTTKSNDFEVHMRVQVLSQNPADRANGTFDTSAGDSIVGEYRGSAIVERYLDPNQTTLPDFATTFPADPTSTVDNYIHYRVVSTKAFAP